MKSTAHGGGNRRRVARRSHRRRGRGARLLDRARTARASCRRSAGPWWSTAPSGPPAASVPGLVAALLRTDGFGLGARGRRCRARLRRSARFRIIRDVFLEQLPAGAADRWSCRWSRCSRRRAGVRGLARVARRRRAARVADATRDRGRAGRRRWRRSGRAAPRLQAGAGRAGRGPPRAAAARQGAPNVDPDHGRHAARRSPGRLRLTRGAKTPTHRRAGGRRRALRARLLAGVVDAPVGRDDPDRALPVVARRGAQGGHRCRTASTRSPRRSSAGGYRTVGFAEQRQRLADLQLPAGLRRVPLPRAGPVLLAPTSRPPS